MQYRLEMLMIALTCFLMGPQITGAAEKNSPLSIRVQFHKQSIVLGEPLILDVTIRNQSDHPIELEFWGSAAYDDLLALSSVWLSKEKTHFQRWSHGFQDLFITAMPRTLQSGEMHSETLIVLGDSNGVFAFQSSGVYFVRVTVATKRNGEKHNFRSEPIKIQITRPEGEQDRQAWKWLKDRALNYNMLIQAPRESLVKHDPVKELSPKKVEPFQRFLRKHPKTVYAPYLALSLGRYFVAQMDNASQGEKARLMQQAKHTLRMVERLTENETLQQLAEQKIEKSQRWGKE